MALLDDLWNDAVGSVDWLKQVILGEFDDHQSTSAMITQLLASFVPGVVIVMSARDLTAVLIRMVRHPEKRENLTEWMILVACAIGLVPALIGAAAGAAAAGVGAVVGGLAGDEAGAALRATALLLIEDGSRMLEKVIQFLRRFVKGDIFRFLREAKFVKYAKPVTEEVGKFLGHMISITQKVIAKASEVRWIGSVGHIIDRLKVLEHGFYDLQRAAVHKIPQVMAEFDSRLQRALGEHMAQADHVVHPNTPAPHPTPKPPVPKRVAARADHPLGKPPGLEPADPLPPKTPPDKNLHPQGVEEEPSADVTKLVKPSTASLKEATAGLKASSGPAADAYARRIADLSTHTNGDADRVVLGQWDPNGGGYIGEAKANGGTWYETDPAFFPDLSDGLTKTETTEKAWSVNEQFLSSQMEKGTGRIDLAGESVDDVLTERPNSFTAREINYLNTNAGNYGYTQEGNSWIKH